MKEGAVTLSRGGLILYCNDGFASLLGQNAAQTSGTPFQQFILQTDVSLFESLLGSANGGRVVLTLVGAGQAEVPVNLSLNPLPGEDGVRMGAHRDRSAPARRSTQELADAGVQLGRSDRGEAAR